MAQGWRGQTAHIGSGVIGAGYPGKACAIALPQVLTVYETPHRAMKRVIGATDAAGDMDAIAVALPTTSPAHFRIRRVARDRRDVAVATGHPVDLRGSRQP